LNNIGVVYLSQNKYEEAEEKFHEAAKEIEKTGLKWKGNSGLVEVYLATEKPESALDILKEMIPRWNKTTPSRRQYHTQYGLALKGVGNLRESTHEFLKAVSMSEELRQRIIEKSGFMGAGYYGGHIRAYKGLVASLSERSISGETIDKEFANYGKDIPSNAFYFSESTKARTLLESIAESARKYNEQELPLSLKTKEQDILNQLSAIEEHWEETYKRGEEAFKELQERKENLKKELDSLITEIRKDYPRYAALKYPRPILAEELPLKDNEVLLEYAIDDKATYLFKVKKGGVQRIIKIPKGKEELEAQINEFILPLQSQYTIENFSAEKGNELYKLLLAEALKDETPDKNIIIVPDGILGLLPFEALVEKKGKDYKDSQYIGDKWKITYAQSASVLALNRMLKPVEVSKSLFALGNPIYDKDDPRYLVYLKKEDNPPIPPLLKGGNLNQYAYRGLATRREWGKTTQDDKEGEEIIYIPLPETETEVKEISKLFNIKPTPPDVLLNIDANETKLRETKLKDYKYLHFATHSDLPGKLQGINEPFILLGQVENKEGDDGFLTLTEVLELKLDADMVVLSACLTGRGKVMEGEGVANFARAFHHAGARSVVVSLWEVASDEAVEYMKTFYTHLKQGKGRGEALRLTRQEMKSKYPNPFYWAPFILHGER
jgi:CHAT domain-containing protein